MTFELFQIFEIGPNGKNERGEDVLNKNMDVELRMKNAEVNIKNIKGKNKTSI